MKPEKISKYQMWKLKKDKQEDIKAYLIIINLLLLTAILIYVLYLMLSYKW